MGDLAILFVLAGSLIAGLCLLISSFTVRSHKNCGEVHMVPLKFLVKRGFLIERGRCSRCHEVYKSVFLMIDKDLLSSRLRRFFLCDKCGTDNLDNWKSYYVLHHDRLNKLRPYRRIKTDLQCKSCRKRRRKVVSREIWDDLLKQS